MGKPERMKIVDQKICLRQILFPPGFYQILITVINALATIGIGWGIFLSSYPPYKVNIIPSHKQFILFILLIFGLYILSNFLTIYVAKSQARKKWL